MINIFNSFLQNNFQNNLWAKNNLSLTSKTPNFQGLKKKRIIKIMTKKQITQLMNSLITIIMN